MTSAARPASSPPPGAAAAPDCPSTGAAPRSGARLLTQLPTTVTVTSAAGLGDGVSQGRTY